MDYRLSGKLCHILQLSGIVFALTLFFFKGIDVLFIVIAVFALLLVVGGLVVKLMFYKCPHCHSGLPLRTLTLPTYCPSCGEKLER